jgi:hypothetical protein
MVLRRLHGLSRMGRPEAGMDLLASALSLTELAGNLQSGSEILRP